MGTFFHRRNLEISFESLTQNHWYDKSNMSLRWIFEKDTLSGIPVYNLPNGAISLLRRLVCITLGFTPFKKCLCVSRISFLDAFQLAAADFKGKNKY